MASPPPEPPSRSLNRQEILEEDEYTAALSHIIARDFFPSLVHLDATNEYLDALSSQDPHLIQASVRRLQQVSETPTVRRGGPWQTPSQTPFGSTPFETPLRSPAGEPLPKRARYDTDMSLDSFQAKYTSEDNASFTQILDDENRKRREKWGWAWEAQRRVEAQREKMLEGREKMLLEAPPVTGVRETFRIEQPKLAGLITAKEETSGKTNDASSKDEDESNKQLAVASGGEPEEPVDVMAPTKDTRSAGVDGWKFKTRNSLMFAPDADISPYDPSTFVVKERKQEHNPKVVKHSNTRLPEQSDTELHDRSEPPSPTRSRIEAAITGTPYRPKSPQINNFSLVPTMPSPSAAEMGPSAVRQLMTWGTLNATPRILSQSDDPAEALPAPSTPFHLSAPSNREALSHRLSAQASKNLRAKAELLNLTPARRTSKPGSMAPPSFTPRRADAPGNLTPAARRLLDRTTMGTAAARRAEAMQRTSQWQSNERAREKDLSRVRWTPTPTASGHKP